jgi:hypothetical protein
MPCYCCTCCSSVHSHSIQESSTFKNFTGSSSTKHSTFTKSSGFQLKQAVSTQQPQIASYLENLAQNLGQIRNLDFLLVAFWISTIIVIIIVMIIIIKKLTRRSSLYVDISSDSKIVQVKLLDFPNATRSFSVITPKERIKLRIRNLFCCGILSITDNPWKVLNTLTGNTIKLPKYVIISPCKTAALRKVFGQPHEILPLVVHTKGTFITIIEPERRRHTCHSVSLETSYVITRRSVGHSYHIALRA